VTVLFFAVFRDFAGTDQAEFELPDGATVAQLIEAIGDRLGADSVPANVAVAVNQEYVLNNTTLQDGDEVALIPPVAGG
jgi:molybdopterin converting factor subunit 1